MKALSKKCSLSLKIIIGVLLVVNVSILFSFNSHAESITLDIKEADAFIYMDDEDIIITRDMSPDDASFQSIGYSYDEIMNIMDNNNICMFIFPHCTDYEIVISANPIEYDDFGSMSENELKNIEAYVAEVISSSGLNISEQSIYSHVQTNFVKTFMDIKNVNTGNPIYGIQYYTVNAGKELKIEMHTNAGIINDTVRETYMDNFINKISFNRSSKVVENSHDITKEYSYYTDKETGLSFKVPKEWHQESMTKDRQFLDVKYVSDTGNIVSLVYGSTDIWDMMPAIAKNGLKREDVNNNFFSDEDLKLYYEEGFGSISREKYAGVEYFVSSKDLNISLGNQSIQAVLYQFTFFENGIMYLFQCSTFDKTGDISQFYEILESVKYPVIENGQDNEDGKPKSESIMYVILITVIVVLLIVLIFYIQRKSKNARNRNVQIKNHEVEHKNLVTSEKEQKVIYCRKCGTKLPADSGFCTSCGTQVFVQESKTLIKNCESSEYDRLKEKYGERFTVYISQLYMYLQMSKSGMTPDLVSQLYLITLNKMEAAHGREFTESYIEFTKDADIEKLLTDEDFLNVEKMYEEQSMYPNNESNCEVIIGAQDNIVKLACKKCGCKNDYDARVCKHCGQRLF